MAISIIPRAQNPWVQSLPNFIQNIALQKIAQNFRAKEAEIERERADAAELRQYKAAGYRESEAHKPTVEVAGKGLVAPKTGIGVQEVGENMVMPVQTMTPYGEEEQVVKGGSITQKRSPEKAVSKWVQLPPMQIGGATVYGQRNETTGEVKYTRFPPKPEAGGGEGGGVPKSAKDLRAEFIKGSQVFVDVRNAYNRVEESAKDPSPAGDLSMIFNYMKILDPESVVREGEFATAANSGSVPSRIRAQYNKVIRGERLDDKMRADFLNRSKMLYDRQVGTHKQLIGEYSRLSKRYGVDPALTIVDYLAPPVDPNVKNKLTQEHITEAEKLKKRYGLD